SRYHRAPPGSATRPDRNLPPARRRTDTRTLDRRPAPAETAPATRAARASTTWVHPGAGQDCQAGRWRRSRKTLRAPPRPPPLVAHDRTTRAARTETPSPTRLAVSTTRGR